LRNLALAAGIGIVLVGAASYGRYWWETGRYFLSTDDAFVGADLTALAPRVSGLINDVLVEDNEQVAKGAVLVRLDDRDFRIAVERAEALVAAQEAALANISANRQLAVTNVLVAEADVTSAKAEAERAASDQERFKSLVATAAAPQQRFELAEADQRKANAAVQRTEAAVQAARQKIAVIDTQKSQAEASLREARATLDLAKLNLSYTEIRAPFDGVVGNRNAKQGGYASIGVPLLSLVPADGLYVDANFKENQLGTMIPGQRAEVIADVAPDIALHGVVVSLAPATGAQFSVIPAENATGNFTKIVQRVPVRIRLDASDARLGVLRPGLSVTATVDTKGTMQGRHSVASLSTGTMR
jgi:membrane fusion protein (multidrug efflux system)